MKELNRDYVRRDTLIFNEYNPDKYIGGVRSFSCDPKLLRLLVEECFADSDEVQNSSPSIDEFLKLANTLGGNVTFIGYAVSPKRIDYRVAVEGFNAIVPESLYNKIHCDILDIEDADEYEIYLANGSYYIHAWWD